MNLIPGIESTGSALSAEKIRLEIIAQNIANSNTTQDASGNVYKRKEVVFEEFIKTPERRVPGYVDENLYQGVRVTDVVDDQTPGRMIYNPTIPIRATTKVTFLDTGKLVHNSESFSNLSFIYKILF